MEEGLNFINDQQEEQKSEVKEIRETLSELKDNAKERIITEQWKHFR